MLRGEPGTIFVLRSDDLGSLDVGSPVFHRRTPVGRVVGYTLDADRDELSLKIFIEAPYQKLVTPNSALLERERHRPDAERERPERQHADARLGARRRPGVRVAAGRGARRAGAREHRLHALRRPPLGARAARRRRRCRCGWSSTSRCAAWRRARRSTCSASRSAACAASRSSTTRSASASRSRSWPTSIRFASARCATRCCATPAARGDAVVLQQLVASGLRAQLRTGNLLTGQLYVALDFIPGPPRTRRDRRRRRGAHADGAGHAERAAAADRRDRPEGEQDPVRRHRPRPAHDAAAAPTRRSASSRPKRRRRSPRCSGR